jgi:hypothetical protein
MGDPGSSERANPAGIIDPGYKRVTPRPISCSTALEGEGLSLQSET